MDKLKRKNKIFVNEIKKDNTSIKIEIESRLKW